MVCPDVEATTACSYPESCTVGTVWVASKPGGRKDGNEYCSPEIGSLCEAVVEEELFSADLVLERGRTKSGRKKRPNALPEQPGYGFWHPGKVSQR